MVTDKFTLDLLSRLADAQLALATSMKGITPSSKDYPEKSLQGIAEALEVIEALLLEVRLFVPRCDGESKPKLH